MSDDNLNKTQPSQPAEGASSTGKRNQRRQLLKAGLIAAPLLVTLKAKPAWALASLGSLGIFYGAYGTVGGRWVSLDKDGKPLADPKRRENPEGLLRNSQGVPFPVDP